MKMSVRTFCSVTILLGQLFMFLPVQGKEILVESLTQFKTELKKVNPGDKLILKDGEWHNVEILFKARGTASKPITLQSQTAGKVILTGQSNLRIAGDYLVVDGLVFKNGYSPTNSVISFRQNKKNLANHSRVTNTVIEDFNKPDRNDSDYWVAIYGKNNRFDHNSLVGKTNKGVTLAVKLDSEQSRQNHHLIDHNYLGPRPILGSNGGETIRVGTSHYSMFDSNTRIENNYFDRCDGEVEIISIKSGHNLIKGNRFERSQGTLTLRHGNGNQVIDNVFFGHNVEHTGGIRVINQDQTIRNNYIEGVRGYRFGSALTIMNGVPNSPVNRYMPVKNARVSNNSLFNVYQIGLAAGSDKERSQPPTDSEFSQNIIFNQDKRNPISIFDDISGIHFSNNATNFALDPQLAAKNDASINNVIRAKNGLLYPQDKKLSKLGVSRDLTPLKRADAGPRWQKERPQTTLFDSGKTTRVSPVEGELFHKVRSAEAGDTLLLADGDYLVEHLLKISKPVTIKAENKGKVTLYFARNTLFEITDGGSLKLQGLNISGKESPDSSGNTLIRTQKWGMIHNFQLIIHDSLIRDLNVNHSFHVFDAGIRALADRIEIRNSQFHHISGDILRLDKERDDLGVYNADRVIVRGNKFEDIGGKLLSLYRGGTDESTFGPHLLFENNTVKNVGFAKRNKQQSSIWLRGVQVTTIQNNNFISSMPILIELTVGEPKTEVSANRFEHTPSTKIIELYPGRPAETRVDNNQFVGSRSNENGESLKTGSR